MNENPYAQWTLNFAAFWRDLETHKVTPESRPTNSSPYVTLGDGERSYARQAELYAQGRSKPGPIVTRAKPGQSPHQYGLARDLTLHNRPYMSDNDLTELYGLLYYLARDNNLESGFAFKGIFDPLHIQLPDWKKRAERWTKFQRLQSG